MRAKFVIVLLSMGLARDLAAIEPVDLQASASAATKFEEGDLAGALADIGKVLRDRPKDGVARYYHGLFVEKKGDLAGAEKSYRLAIELKPGLAEAWANLCALRYQAKDSREAIKLCKRAVELDYEVPAAWYNLGLANLDLGHVKEAAYAFERFTIESPKNADGWMNLGAATIRAGNKKGAVTAFREATRLSPNDFLAHFNLGTALAALGDLDAAASALGRATELRPDYMVAFHRLGSVERRRGRPTVAVIAQEKARALSPNDPSVALELGLAYSARRQKGDDDRAVVELGRAEKLARSAWEPPFYLGLVHSTAGRCAEAKKAFERYLGRDPKGARTTEVNAAMSRCKGG